MEDKRGGSGKNKREESKRRTQHLWGTQDASVLFTLSGEDQRGKIKKRGEGVKKRGRGRERQVA